MNKTVFEAVAAGLGAFVGFLFGALDGLFYALIAFIVLDYITGVIVALINKNLSSEIGFKGILKKVLMFVLVALANIIDVQIIGGGSTLRTAVIFVLLANDGISIIENVGNIGMPIPKPLIDILQQIKKKNNNESEEIKNGEN